MTAEQADIARVAVMAAQNAAKLEYVAEALTHQRELIDQLKAGSVGSTTALVETLGYAIGCIFDVLELAPDDRAQVLNRVAGKWAQEIESVNGTIRMYRQSFNVDEIAKND